MKKPNSAKERNLIKGAIRRVFSRSELRRRALDKALVKDYGDPNRKRVSRWGRCAACQKLEPLYLMEVDHKIPLVETHQTLDELSWDEVVDRLWCSEDNLQTLCKPCHRSKSKLENAERRRLKKDKNK